MIDIRYHIYSIAAVFLALAVGIVIGTSFAKSFPSDASGRQTIQRYERDMRTLRGAILQAHNSAVKKEAEVKAARDYCRVLMPNVVKNKLYWKNVAVVQTGDADDLTGSVKAALSLAGAQVQCTVDVSQAFAWDKDVKISEALAGTGLGSTYEPKVDRDRLFRILAQTICAGKHPDLVPKLETAGLAKFSGNYETPCGLVVLVGGSRSVKSSLAAFVDALLAPEMAKLGVTVVGCESSEAKASYVPVWHKSEIATVDNADRAMGQMCMIYALGGEAANYGTKDTAERLFPKSLESK